MASGRITKRTVDGWIAQRFVGFVWDDGITGFGAKFSKSGAVVYVLQFRMGGREASTRRYTIGNHGSPWTPTTAREEAQRLLISIAQGTDPAEADRQRRREAVELAFANYAAKFEQTLLKPKWKNMVARSLRLHVTPVLGKKPLPKIKRHDIVAIFDRMPATQVANRRNVFAVLRRLFRWAVSRGDLDRSPMEGMETPPPVKPRDRWLSDAELGRIWHQTYGLHRCFGPIVRLLIVTGQRREEVASMSWEEIDQATMIWTIPSNRAKNGEPNLVPLNDLAIEVLSEMAGSSVWPVRGHIFRTSSGGGFTGYHKCKEKLDRLIANDGGEPMRPWRLHDLRRTLATGFQRLGVRFEVTEAILNHVGGARAGVAGIYQRHDWKQEKRAAMDVWNGHLSSIIAGDT